MFDIINQFSDTAVALTFLICLVYTTIRIIKGILWTLFWVCKDYKRIIRFLKKISGFSRFEKARSKRETNLFAKKEPSFSS